MRDLNQVLTLKTFTGEGVSVEAPEDPREPKQLGRGEETCGRHSTHARTQSEERSRRRRGLLGISFNIYIILHGGKKTSEYNRKMTGKLNGPALFN